MKNTLYTNGPGNKKQTDTSSTANGIPSTADGNRSPKELIEKPSDQNEKKRKGILTQMESDDDGSSKETDTQNQVPSLPTGNAPNPGKIITVNRNIYTVEGNGTPIPSGFTTANSNPILITPRISRYYSKTPAQDTQATTKKQVIHTSTPAKDNTILQNINKNEFKSNDDHSISPQEDFTQPSPTNSPSYESAINPPEPIKILVSNRKPVDLEPELEPLCSIIMLQHEVFNPHFIELGNISLTLSKDISKKKENYSLLKDHKKIPRSLRVKVELTTSPNFSADTKFLHLKSTLKIIVTDFIKQGTDVMTEWAQRNIYLLLKERCRNILLKALSILECITSYHSEIFIQPSWPSLGPKHLPLFLFKLNFSNLFFKHQELLNFFDLPQDTVTLLGSKILTKQTTDKEALSTYNTLNITEINNSTEEEYEFLAETLNLFDCILDYNLNALVT